MKRNFDELDYCKDCDQLIHAEDILVWTNIKGRQMGESRISNIDYFEAENLYNS